MLNYPDALKTVYGYIRRSTTLDTARVARSREILRRTGDPQTRFPAVHVTGTKGKGSVCAMLAAVLRANGLCVGLYTSPHLHTLRERIQVDGEAISPEAFAALVAHLRPTFDAVAGTAFPEVMTALALHHFAACEVDVAVVEVHVGGEYDATNVLQTVCSVVNVIDYDHTDLLGETLVSIARHKAGVMRPGVPVVSAAGPEAVLETLRERAAALGAPLTVADVDLPYMVEPPTSAGQSVVLDGERFATNLRGAHQGDNLALAVGVLRVLARRFSLTDLHAGLNAVHWPGRLEMIPQTATVGRPVLLDIAHTLAAAEALRRYLDAALPSEGPRLVIYGSKPSKDIRAIVGAICRPGDMLIPVQVSDPPTAAPDQIWERVAGLGLVRPLPPAASIAAALEQAAAHSSFTLVAGSIFVAAAVRARLLGIPPEPGSAY